MCGATKGRMDLDHRQPLQDAPERASDRTNLWWLCSSCHSRKTAEEVRQRRQGEG
jgi:5-methylcytosine-specific restriction endonuclease McrA